MIRDDDARDDFLYDEAYDDAQDDEDAMWWWCSMNDHDDIVVEKFPWHIDLSVSCTDVVVTVVIEYLPC